MNKLKSLNMSKKELKQSTKLYKYGAWLYIINFVVFFIIFYIFNRASIAFSTFTPFGIAMLYACLYAKFNISYLAPSFILASSLADLSLKGLYISLGAVVIAIIAVLLHKKLKKPITRWHSIIYLVISYWCYIWQNLAAVDVIIALIISIILGVAFLCAAMHFFYATIMRGFAYNLTSDQNICGLIVVMVLFMGLAGTNFYHFELSKIVISFVALLTAYLFKGMTPIAIAIAAGLGATLYTSDPTYIASFTLFSAVSMAFKSNIKVFSAIAVVLVEIVLGVYFKSYHLFDWQSIVCVSIGATIFVCLPLKIFVKVMDNFGGYREKIAIRSVINRSKQGICKRMNEVAEVFAEMDKVFRGLVVGGVSDERIKEMLGNDIIDKCCQDCPQKNSCLRVNGQLTSKVFENLTDAGLERGRVTLLDVPSYLASKCNKLNQLISTTNLNLTNYKNYTNLISSMDSSRLLIADQLNGLSKIISNLSSEVNLNITFDISKEQRIIEELSYENVYVIEAIVYEESAFNKNITLVVKDSTLDEKVIERVVSKICNATLSITEKASAPIAGATILTLKVAPNYDIVFGSASCSKAGIVISGDTHSLIRIDDGKYMVAVCDGMGSGNSAHKVSELTISLIENFYKAGFDNEIILSSVNRLLMLDDKERFSALDVCVMDLRQNTCDFIKLGAPYGFVKHKNGTEIIETCGLPIGVLEEMTPHITKKVIEDFDNIILVSDGISDAFGTKESLCDFVNNLDITNPQTIADEILDRAMDIVHGVNQDDMTVMVVRIFPTR